MKLDEKSGKKYLNDKTSLSYNKRLEDAAAASVESDTSLKKCAFWIAVGCAIFQIVVPSIFFGIEIFIDCRYRLPDNEIISYLKYSFACSGVLFLLVGYWFGSKGGFPNMINSIVRSKINK
jgi:hypothetical protein